MVCRGFVWVLCFDACCLCSALGFALVLVWLLFDCLGWLMLSGFVVSL